MTRRPAPWLLALVLIGATSLLVAGCGDADDDADDAAEVDGTPGAAVGEAAAFPVEIEHTFGTTTIEVAPERIVSIGYQEQDSLYALGADPVAVRYWFGDDDDVIFPWAEDAAGDADPEILNMPPGELNYEAIAALQPDLIMGIYSGITDEEFETLSQIAPTVAQPEGYPTYGTPWDVSVEVVGRALGRADEAAALIDDLQARFADAAADHPEWEGQQFAVVTASSTDRIATFASFDPRARFFASLGFEPIPEIDELAGDQFYVELSAENIDIVDGGLIVWDQLSYVDGGRATVEASPLVAIMDSVQAGTVTDTSGDVEAAFGFNTVLSLPYVLDVMIPRLEAALPAGS